MVYIRSGERIQKNGSDYLDIEGTISNLKTFIYNQKGVDDESGWEITNYNKDYSLCDTYPQCLTVPKSFKENMLKEVSQFRSRARFPVLSWLGPAPDHVPLLRSAQPLCGMFNRRSTIDETYLRIISQKNRFHNPIEIDRSRIIIISFVFSPPASSSNNVEPKFLYIFDARPFKNALANYTAGGGYENEKYYTGCKLVFLNIENIHAMRDSLGATSSEQFLMSTLENSKWLEHIRLILDGALVIVEKICSGHPCLVHCSDGWDRTAQVSFLNNPVF